VDEIRIGYFLEDIGQELFLKALVNRVAREMGLPSRRLRHEVRNATGGRGAVLEELRRFLRDVNHEREHPFALLVVAIDGDCHSYRQRRDEIWAKVEQSGYLGPVICAVADPHIERWYLADPRGLQQVLEVSSIPEVPSYKCERGRYKQALRDAIRQTGVVALLGGLEYGPDIAEVLDSYTVGKADAGFKHFLDELQAGLALFVREQEEWPRKSS
jgi:hypothetical protein